MLMPLERALRWSLVTVAIIGLATGIFARIVDQPRFAQLAWTLATIPVLLGLAASIVRDFLSGRVGVDAVALLSMATALLLGESLAGAVVALMYSGGNVLEDFAVFRAEHDLRLLVDRAPRVAHRYVGGGIEDVPVAAIAVDDRLLVRAGEVIPVDGIVDVDSATIDESAVTGEPIPISRARGSAIFSGTLNAGDTFEMTASSIAGQSTYAGIVRLVTAAQTAKAPFVRLADRYALAFLPVTVVMAGVAWLISGDLIRSLAVLVAATPCPLILAAPVALHWWCRPGSAARNSRQRRRSARGNGAGAYRSVRQDGNADRRRCAAAFHRRRSWGASRGGALARRLARAGLAPCSRTGRRPGRNRPRPSVEDATRGQRGHRDWPKGHCRWQAGRCGLTRHDMGTSGTPAMGFAGSAACSMAIGACRFRCRRRAADRRTLAGR
jgi:hypothetical protein